MIFSVASIVIFGILFVNVQIEVFDFCDVYF